MNKVILLLLFAILWSCNTYEVPQPMVKVNIHVINKENGEAYAGFKAVIRSSDFSLSNNSSFFSENDENVRYDSTYTNEYGDLSFDIPFVKGIPQRYYELFLSTNNEIPISEGRFLNDYIQHDTFRIGPLTHLDIKVRNDSCRLVSFSTLGYQTREDYQRDSVNVFINPDYVARLGITKAKSNLISKTLPFDCNKFMVLQIIDRSVHPPLMIKYDVIEMKKDSVKVHEVRI